jgi:hypothetical protein
MELKDGVIGGLIGAGLMKMNPLHGIESPTSRPNRPPPKPPSLE